MVGHDLSTYMWQFFSVSGGHKGQVQRCLYGAVDMSPKLSPVPEAGLYNSCVNLQAPAVHALGSALDKLYQTSRISHYNK